MHLRSAYITWFHQVFNDLL